MSGFGLAVVKREGAEVRIDPATGGEYSGPPQAWVELPLTTDEINEILPVLNTRYTSHEKLYQALLDARKHNDWQLMRREKKGKR